MPDCISINPLQRSGTSQYKRVLQALLPGYAQVDEREYADLILFAKNYAAYLTYFDASNKSNGDWLPLMKMDISVSLATIARQQAGPWFTYVQELYKQIQDTEPINPGDLDDLRQYYTSIYHLIATLIYQLDEQLQSLPKDFAFTEYLNITITSRLAEPWSKLKTYYTESKKPANGMIDDAAPLSPPETPIQVQRVSDLLVNNLSPVWTTVPFIPPINGTDEADKIKNTINHSIFKGLIEGLLKTFSAIIDTAGKYLLETLEDFPTHTPHYALYLTFLKLFRVAQEHVNKFTDRHLSFYYKDILRLQLQTARPDQVHLLFELQKNIAQHLLKKDTVFKAGKNKAGQELFYALTDDIVVNKGKVKSIKSVLAENNTTYTTLYAAPISNSADGKGAALITADKSWEPFGDPNSHDTATIGFAVAHPVLFMKEGLRTVNLKFSFNSEPFPIFQQLIDQFSIKITGAKGWHDVTADYAVIFGDGLYINFSLPADAPPFAPYNEKIHQSHFDTGLPIVQFLVKNVKGENNYISQFADSFVTGVDILVTVSGLKDVTLQNEVGPLDAAKPFQLFGPQPHMDSAFIIGSKEIFLKNHYAPVSAYVNIEWDKVDKLAVISGNSSYTYFVNKVVTTAYLEDGTWLETGTKQTLFEHDSADDHTEYQGNTLHVRPYQTITLDLPQFQNDADFTPNQQYDINSRNGFTKIIFRGPTDFGHGDYIKRFTKEALKGASANLPDEPYTPTVKALTLNYSVSAHVDLSLSTPESFSEQNGYFYHITPFGHAVQHRSILGATATIPMIQPNNNEGELYIGIEQFKAGQSLHLLFKVSEGSADPAYNRQPLQWSYLAAGNQWKTFDEYAVSDQTNDLTKTGIIRFAVPATATDTNTLMGEQLFWIRGTAAVNTPAICNLIAIHAQAATAVLVDHHKSGLVYTDILPAGTIAKLLISDTAIKSIQQPYSSFGGRTKEPAAKFYNRVSERLRHKNRAITMWDYERLVLQQFPEIYKVKCINHTKINTTGTGDNELCPGHVLVVPIPDLAGLNAINPLKPQTSIGTLEDIKKHLRRHTSPFVKLEVKNARFEEIQLDFKVKFLTDDGAYYRDILIREIEQYLSPWAYGGTQEIEFGGKISKSKLLDFIEERSYVDYLTCFKMHHIVNGIKSGDVEEAVATSSRSVFVSYAGNEALNDPKHIIDYLNPDCNC